MRPARAPRLTDADREAWAAYARSVRPLAGRDAPSPPPAQAAPAQAASAQAASAQAATGPTPPTIVSAAPAPRRPAQRPPAVDVGVHPPGVDSATWTRLRTGRLAPERSLDLHGRTAQGAHTALLGFLHRAHTEGVRCVEIVTGHGGRTGGGVIRRELPLWLNLPALRPLVLAATHPPDNPGATRLLLRRIRPR